jgi:hypothetical protein
LLGLPSVGTNNNDGAPALNPGDIKAMKKLMLIALSTLDLSAHAADDKKFYIGGGASFWKLTDTDRGDGNLNLTALEGIAGFEIFPWLAVEGRLGLGVERETDSFGYSAIEKVELQVTKPATTPDGAETTETVEGVAIFTKDAPVKAELNYYGSIFIKPQIKNDTAALYALIGVTAFDADFSAGAVSYKTDLYKGDDIKKPEDWIYYDSTGDVVSRAPESYSESDGSFSMGIGVSFFFDQWTVNAEWKNFLQSFPLGDTDTTLESSGVTGSVTYNF